MTTTQNESKSSSPENRVKTTKYSRTSIMDLKIAINFTWPSFRNVALDIQKALEPYCNSVVLDWRDVKPGGNILFIETVRKDTLKFLKRLPSSNIVFYGTTEGHSLLDKESIELARNINVVAVSNFVKQMLEEVGIPVAGVVHHGLDMYATNVDSSFLQSLEERFRDRLVTLTLASNDPRKGLEELFRAYKLTESRVLNSFLVLHSEPKRYYDCEERRYRQRHYDLPKLVAQLGLERTWLTNRYGLMTPEEVNALYKLCHIYVSSSLSEGFCLPILEAFRFNKPVIAVDAPPFNEVIEDGRTGKLIPYEKTQWYNHKNKILFKMHVYKPQNLAEVMTELLNNRDLLERMKNQIMKKKHRWSIHAIYPRLLSYF